MSLLVRALFLLIFVVAACAAGEVPDFDRFADYAHWTSQEQTLLRDMADESLDDHSTLRASLVVAGHNVDQIDRLLADWQTCVRACRRQLNANASRQAQLRSVFGYLSETILHGQYKPELYDVGQTISSGDFNCLTATILFQSLCQAASIDVQACWEPAHVRCWSPVAGNAGYVVETTASSTKKAVGPLTTSNRLDGRRLNDSQLVAKVFYNRGVSTMKSEQYPAALTSTWAGCLLDPNDRPAQSNLRACLNNWALSASQKRDLDLAWHLLDEGVKLDPDYEPFTRNRAILFDR